jgi:transcriptional regulator with XRE-family HTH domain
MTRQDLRRAATSRSLPPEEIAQLGRRIQDRRVERGITLDVMAQRTGFSKGYLSRIENGKKTPPLSTLGRIALALATDVHALLVAPLQHEGEPFFRVLRKADRHPVERAESAFGYRYETLGHAAAGARMAPFVVQLPREIDRHVFFEHDGEELVFLLSGRVEWQIGHERHVLEAGDALSLDSRLPHRARALDGEATALIVLLPRREMLSAGSAGSADAASRQANRPDGDGAAV